MHSCYFCGCACYCGGDIDDCEVGDICREGCGCDEDAYDEEDDCREAQDSTPSKGPFTS